MRDSDYFREEWERRYPGEWAAVEALRAGASDYIVKPVRNEELLHRLSQLAAVRAAVAKNPDDYLILPELISKEPLGPMVRRGDDEWRAIVTWTVFGLLEAEEKPAPSLVINRLNPNMVKRGDMYSSECILCGTCADSCKRKAIRYCFGISRRTAPDAAPRRSPPHRPPSPAPRPGRRGRRCRPA